MAKVSNAHSNNTTLVAAETAKRTRTQSAEPTKISKTARTTRQLRSQSAEPTEPSTLPTKGRGAQVKSTAEVSTGKKRGRPKKTAAAAPEGLDTVREVVNVEEESRQSPHEAQLQAKLQGEPQYEYGSTRRVSRMSAVSGISGTTTKTSFSEDELEQMDPNDMIDNLSSLASASSELARLLMPQGTSTLPETFKDIRRFGSRHNRRHSKLLQNIKVYKPDFGSEEYIRLGLVFRALFGVDDLHHSLWEVWRPDNIIYQINLTQMLNVLLINYNPGDWSIQNIDALARLEDAFPTAIAGNEYKEASLEFWLNLAAQLAIFKLDVHSQADPNFNPHNIINNTFYDEGTFRHANTLHINSLTSPAYEGALAMVDRLVSTLKMPFEPEGPRTTAAIGKLKSQFSWKDFVNHVLRYFTVRDAELQGCIDEAGGVQQIQYELLIEYERRKARAKLAGRASDTGRVSRKSLDGKGARASLRRATKRVSQQATAAGLHELDETLRQDKAWHIEEPYSVRLSQAAPRSHHNGPPPPVQPSRSLLDPQPNAQRISTTFDEEETQPLIRPQHSKTPVRTGLSAVPVTGKWSRTQMEEDEEEDHVPDPTQDAGFQTDARDFSAADQRRTELDKTVKAAACPRSSSRNVEAGPSNLPSSPARPGPAKRPRLDPEPDPRHNPGSTLPERPPAPEVDDDELSPGSRFARAKVDAKLNRVTATQAKTARERLPWTVEEETALIRLIEQHGGEGVSYTFLKSFDEQDERRLRRRTAEDIRFKARNMKTILLMGGGFLPENFEHVALAKKEMDRLKARGIDYQQEQIRRRAVSIDFDD